MGKDDDKDKFKDKYPSLIALHTALLNVVTTPDFASAAPDGFRHVGPNRQAETEDDDVTSNDVVAVLNATYLFLQDAELPSDITSVSALAALDLSTITDHWELKTRTTTLSGLGPPLAWRMPAVESHPVATLGAGIPVAGNTSVDYSLDVLPTTEQVNELLKNFPPSQQLRIAKAGSALTKWAHKTLADLEKKANDRMSQAILDVSRTTIAVPSPLGHFARLNAVLGRFISEYIKDTCRVPGPDDPFRMNRRPNEPAEKFLDRFIQGVSAYTAIYGRSWNHLFFHLIRIQFDKNKFLLACDNSLPTVTEIESNLWVRVRSILAAIDRNEANDKPQRTQLNDRPDHNGQNRRQKKRRDEHTEQPSEGNGNGKRQKHKSHKSRTTCNFCKRYGHSEAECRTKSFSTTPAREKAPTTIVRVHYKGKRAAHDQAEPSPDKDYGPLDTMQRSFEEQHEDPKSVFKITPVVVG
eukprot:CAMPEP_0202103266 /NCGR_PEP_ID=MMETSP0965-20130614/4789_1 /ASSEMBLY_ACC=CAM_ASM_000507 /TAXON_ID=4773 /ORGANISM="Schizochytrium aggregatum, Strain ATCC28209" /LENGTH=466 /DNA_ID=CAMNT_0048672061 /DNA_START=527 /DNA_END=1923 /DNA_ORIENTATION=-